MNSKITRYRVTAKKRKSFSSANNFQHSIQLYIHSLSPYDLKNTSNCFQMEFHQVKMFRYNNFFTVEFHRAKKNRTCRMFLILIFFNSKTKNGELKNREEKKVIQIAIKGKHIHSFMNISCFKRYFNQITG
jgi:hypothetical protein